MADVHRHKQQRLPAFRKYANMHFLGIPFPDTLFKAKEK
jgi:hypothetical protein